MMSHAAHAAWTPDAAASTLPLADRRPPRRAVQFTSPARARKETAMTFAPGLVTRLSVASLHLTFARTMAELSEMTLEEIGRRALEAGYKLGFRNSEVPLKQWVSAGAQNIYAVIP